MARRPPTREWRDDLPRSFRYVPPAPPAPEPAKRNVLRLVVGLLVHR